MRTDPTLSTDFPPDGVIPDWREWLSTENEEQATTLRRQTSTGRRSGTDSFVASLEVKLQRVLKPQKRGPKHATHALGQGELFECIELKKVSITSYNIIIK